MPEAYVKDTEGVSALYSEGIRKAPVLYQLSDIPGSDSNTYQAYKNIAAFGKAGIDFVGVDTDLRLGWFRTTGFDPEPMIEEVSSVLDANPNAKVLIRLHVNPPYWWMKEHPEECTIYRTPQGDVEGIDDGESQRLIRDDHNLHLRVSLASERWMKEACEKLSAFCEAIREKPEGKALLAIQIACGINGEWHYWGTDVSEPMQRRFRQYLRDTYATEEALRKAWNDPSLTYENARFSPETFRPGDLGDLRDPRTSMPTIDSQRAFQYVVAEDIQRFCRVVKEELPGVLAGSFYGYYLGTGGNDMTIEGHLRVKEVSSDHQDIDFLCGPFCYMQNRKPDGVPMQRALLESLRLNRMLWLTEMDQSPAGTEWMIGGTPERFDETVSVLRRNTLQPILGGHGFWYYDHRIVPRMISPDSRNTKAGSIFHKNGWWDKPELMEEIAKIQKLIEQRCLKPYQPAADVLLVYDTESFYYRSRVSDQEYLLHEALMRSGIVFDSIFMHDLDKAEMERYRVIIFANVFYMTAETRQLIRKQTAGKMTIWLGSEGVCDGKGIGTDLMTGLMGMNIRFRKNCAAQYTLKTDRGEQIIDFSAEAYNPQYTIEEEPSDDFEILGVYPDGEAAAARKGNSCFFSIPVITSDLVRMLMKRAGVHCYNDGPDPVMAGFGMVLINCASGGKRTLTLRNGTQLQLDLPPYTTAVFDGESGERLL